MSIVVINPDDYVDRWLTNYIVYHHGRLISRGEVSEAKALFGRIYDEQVDRMRTTAMQQQLSTISVKSSAKGRKAQSSAEIIRELAQGDLLGATLDKIAEAVNLATDDAYQNTGFNNYKDKIIEDARGYRDLLASTPDVQRVNEFFNLIVQGLTQAKAIDMSVLEALTGLGTALIGDSFSIKNNIVPIANSDINVAKKVVDTLERAVNKFQAAGTLSPRSFSQTIANIFKVIAARMQELMIAESLEDIEDNVDQLFNGLILKEKDGKLQWVNKGTRKAGKRSNVKVQVFNTDGLQLQIKKGRATYDIEIGTDISVVNTGNNPFKKTNIQLIGRASLKNYFIEGQEKYLAYNMLAHEYSKGFQEAVNRVKGSVAATFFNNWMRDSGFKAYNGQKAQFLLINERIYPVMRIIANICDEFARGHSSSLETAINMDTVDNSWIGTKPNRKLGMIRSELVNDVMDTLYMSINLNSNILTKYAY